MDIQIIYDGTTKGNALSSKMCNHIDLIKTFSQRKISSIEQNISVLNAKVDELRDVMGFFMEYQTFLMQQTDDTSENPGTYINM